MWLYFEPDCSYVHFALDDDEADKLEYLYNVLDFHDSEKKSFFESFVFSFGLSCLFGIFVDESGNYNKKLLDFLIEE